MKIRKIGYTFLLLWLIVGLLKLVGIINWSWWLIIFLPLTVLFGLLLFLLFIILFFLNDPKTKKLLDDLNDEEEFNGYC